MSESAKNGRADHLFVPLSFSPSLKREICHRCGLEKWMRTEHDGWVSVIFKNRDDNRGMALGCDLPCDWHEDGPFFTLWLQGSQVMRDVASALDDPDTNLGYCARCGQSTPDSEPDAIRQKPCEHCGADAVYGANRVMEIFARQGRG